MLFGGQAPLTFASLLYFMIVCLLILVNSFGFCSFDWLALGQSSFNNNLYFWFALELFDSWYRYKKGHII